MNILADTYQYYNRRPCMPDKSFQLECVNMFFIRKKPVFRENPKKERSELIRQIEVSKTAILSAQNQFEQVVDPTLIDCYIYELNAAQLRYQFLLRDLKMRETQEVTPL